MNTWRSIRLLALVMIATPLGAEIPKPDDAPQPKAPAESKKCFKLPEGFRIDLIASEPLIRDPSCLAWDERGRLFVTEIHGYNLEGHLDVRELNKTGELDLSIRRVRVDEAMKAEARKGQRGSLKLLRDRNGDGRMDEVIVWADDLPAAYGVVPARGGLIVMAEPHIFFFADTNGDDKPDVRERIFTGFEREKWSALSTIQSGGRTIGFTQGAVGAGQRSRDPSSRKRSNLGAPTFASSRMVQRSNP